MDDSSIWRKIVNALIYSGIYLAVGTAVVAGIGRER